RLRAPRCALFFVVLLLAVGTGLWAVAPGACTVCGAGGVVAVVASGEGPGFSGIGYRRRYCSRWARVFMTEARVSENGMLSMNSSAGMSGRPLVHRATRVGPALYAASARSTRPPKRSIMSFR